jgi:hypothetical protein
LLLCLPEAADIVRQAERGTAMGKETGSGLLAGFESNHHLGRFLVAVALCALMLAGFVLFIAPRANLKLGTGPVQLEIEGQRVDSGSLTSFNLTPAGMRGSIGDNSSFTTVLVPGNQLWVDSGIEVSPGETVRLVASGSVNLDQKSHAAMLADPAIQSRQQFSQMVDPAGGWINGHLHLAEVQKAKPSAVNRNLIFLLPGHPIGSLVGTIVPDKSVFRHDIRAGKPFSINEARPDGDGYVHTGPSKGRLFLAVNDLVASRMDKDRRVYLYYYGPEGQELSAEDRRSAILGAYRTMPQTDAAIREKEAELLTRWNAMAESNFREGFYEDNSGLFLVSVVVSKAAAGTAGRAAGG